MQPDDRVALVEDLREELEGLVMWVTWDANLGDFVLAVHGCETACTDLSAFEGYPKYSAFPWRMPKTHGNI